jgi:DNA-binding response OmpR family regulator
MRVMIAEDDPVSRRLLEATLQKWGFDVLVTCDGTEAFNALRDENCPRLLVLDWMMPGMDGTALSAFLRERADGDSFYILLLTAKTQKEDIVAGLQAGADDYITKPFHHEELRARIDTGRRIVDLQRRLSDRIAELEGALAEVEELSGLLPICSYCKRIREGKDYWESVEQYIAGRSKAQFSHAVCPDCYEKIVKPQIDEL